MKDKICKLYELQQKNLIYSPWAKETSLQQRTQELKLEIDEALEELEKQDWQGFKDELGDVLWDCLGVIARAEFENKLTIHQVLDHIYEKFSERKPFLIEERHISREEEEKVWHIAKKKQKERANARN